VHYTSRSGSVQEFELIMSRYICSFMNKGVNVKILTHVRANNNIKKGLLSACALAQVVMKLISMEIL